MQKNKIDLEFESKINSASEAKLTNRREKF